MNKTFKIIVKLGTLSLPSGAVVFFWGDRLRQPRDGTMLDETPADEERSYIDSMADDFMENLPIMLLRPVSLAAELARGAVGALGERKIKFSSYSDPE